MKIQFETEICNILAYFNNDNTYTQLKTDRKTERNFLESLKNFYAFWKWFYFIQFNELQAICKKNFFKFCMFLISHASN